MEFKKVQHKNVVKEYFTAKTKMIISMLLTIALVVIAFLNARLISTPFSIAGEDLKPMIQANLDKYINYSIDGQSNGTLVQYSLRTSINYGDENTYIPAKQNNIEIALKEIDGKYPSTVNVVSKSTQATNGNKQNAAFSYDNTTGKLVISATNQDQDGNIVYSEGKIQDTDEYVIICNYETYTSAENERKIGFGVIVKSLLNREENPEITSDGNFEVNANKNIGDLTDVKYSTDEIYNGYIKSNIINGTNYSTKYKEISEITISKKDLQDELELHEKNINSIYKSTKVFKRNIKNVLGQEGSLIIEDENGNKLGEVNQETEYLDDGTYTINYEGNIESIKVKTSKVINEGIIELENVKEIKQEIQDIDSVKAQTQIIGKKEDTQVYSKNTEKETKIEEAKTQVDFTINTTDWTNERQNETVLDLKLNTNGAKNNLYKNPVIKIELPEEVEKVILGDCTLVYGYGLQANEVKVETNENNRYQITASITGEQTQYNENDLGLTTEIKIPANIILKQDIESKTDSIKVTVVNEYGEVHTAEYTKEIKINNYKEDLTVQLNEEAKLNELFATVRDGAQNNAVNDNLKLEVAPTKGETVLADGDTVYEGEFIKYNIKVTNTSDQDMENVKVVATIPEGVTYGELDADYYSLLGKYEYIYDSTLRSKEINVGTIKAGESYNVFYEVKVNDLTDGETEKEIETIINTFVGEQSAQNFECKYTINKAKAQVFVEGSTRNIKDGWHYCVTILGNETVDLELHLPEQAEFSYITSDREGGEGKWQDGFLINENVLTATVEPAKYYIGVIIDSGKFKNYNTANNEVELSTIAKVKVDGTEYVSNENRIKVKYEHVSIVMESDNEGEEVKYGDEINYKITLTNDGGNNLSSGYKETSVNVLDYLPEDIDPISVTYETWEEEKIDITHDENNDVESYTPSGIYNKITKTEEIFGYLNENNEYINKVDLSINIPFGESAILNVKGTAKQVYERTKVENSAIISDTLFLEGNEEGRIATEQSNVITHYIVPEETEEEPDIVDPDNPDTPVEPDNPENPDNPSNPDDPNNPESPENRYNISGLVWDDTNKDGQRQEDEPLLNNIGVSLIDLGDSSKIQRSTTTNQNGKYSFDNVNHGNYIVMFRYDTSIYKVTEYQKTNVNSQVNSDVMSQTITLNGEQIVVGLTDIISLNTNEDNIDMGLIEAKPCDMKAEKYISKISVTTQKGTKQYSYDNSSMAKVEIRSKEIEGATVTIEYKIVVTNIGEVPGKVGKVIDTLPQDITLASNVSQNWIRENNGEYSNSSFTNQTIGAGESIELKLIAVKQMTANATGIFTNNVELKNVESIEKVSESNITNNVAKADVIISVSTGAVIIYISLIMLVLTILFIGIYVIRKYNISNIIKISMCLLILTSVNITESICISTAPDSDGFRWLSVDGREMSGGLYDFWGKKVGYSHCTDPTVDGSPKGYQGNPNWNDWVGYYTRTYNGMSSASSHSEKSNPNLSFNLTKKNSEINITTDNNKLLYGPFSFTCDGDNVSYSLFVEGKNGNVGNTYSICDSTGKTISLSGKYTKTKSFYIKIEKKYVPQGLRKIVLRATKSGTRTVKNYTDGYANYHHDRWQDCRTDKKFRKYTTNTTETVTKSLDIEWSTPSIVEIEKVDADNNKIKLQGVEITLKNQSSGKTYKETTDKNGKAVFYGVQAGKYTIEETKLPSEYGYITAYKKTNQQINSGQLIQLVATNTKQTGTLRILKEDQTWEIKNSGQSTERTIDDTKYKKLEGIEFKLKKDGKYVRLNDANQIVGTALNGNRNIVTKMELKNKKEEGTTLITDDSGNIKINNILTGNYEVEEVGVGDNYYGYTVDADKTAIDGDYVSYQTGNCTGTNASDFKFTKGKTTKLGNKDGKAKTIPITITRQTSTESSNVWTYSFTGLTVYNQKKYIKVSGNVWEEELYGKDSTFDSILEDNDVKVQGIKVTLKNSDGTDVEKPEEKSNFVNPVYTDENGHYAFDDVLIDNLDQYYIEFEYDGEIYTTSKSYNELPEEGTKYTKANAPANTSKAQEVSSQRTSIDNSYTNVTGTDKEDKSNVNNSFDVNYTFTKAGDTDAHSKSKNIETFEGQLSSDGKVRNVNKFTDYENYDSINKMIATTKETEYNILGGTTVDAIRKNGTAELTNRNCGLAVREQVNLAVSADLINVIVGVNGYTSTYMYKSSANYRASEETSAEDMFRLDVKAKKWGYFRKLYASDIVYNGTDSCKVYMTYGITVINNSNTLSATVSRLANYYDSNYTRVESGTVIENEQSADMKLTGEVNWSEKEDAGNGYSVEYVENSLQLAAGESKTIYVKYELSNQAVVKILSGDISLNNIAEINQYTTYFGDNTYYHSGTKLGEKYASIDRNSAPGNSTIGDNTTYEDDTMAAPSLTMQLAENERTIEGNVFEDIAEGLSNVAETHTGEKRLGNGVYDNTDNDIGNVKVELFTYSGNNAAESQAVWSRDYNDEASLASMWVSRLKQDRIEGQVRDDIDNRYEAKYEVTGTIREEITNNSNVIGYKIPARVNTDNTGHYKIYGIIPGKYILKFTYGNGSVIYKEAVPQGDLKVDYYKSTIIKSDTIKNAIQSSTPSMWYKTTMNDANRTSDAADDKNSYDVSKTENTLYNSNQYTSKVETKSAYTAPLNIKFEMTDGEEGNETSQSTQVLVTNSDGTQQVETLITYNVKNVDFGIVEKARQEYEVIKEISNVKITLSNGQVLIDGDPRSTEIKYVKLLRNTPFNRANTVDMEIDNELLVGSTLEVEYSIYGKNDSEINYLTYEYYYFGTESSNPDDLETLKITKTIDYLSNELAFDKSTLVDSIKPGKFSENTIKTDTEEISISDYLDSNIIQSAKRHSNVLVLVSNKELKPGDTTEEWKYKTSKLLASTDELTFENYVETIEVVTTSVLSDKNILGNLDSLPTNYSSFAGSNETDFYSGNIMITSPTGENRNVIIIVVGAIALLVVAEGIWIIKRKVL